MVKGPGRPTAVQQVVESMPFLRWLGVQVVDLKPGHSQVQLSVRPEMLQVAGLLHGGIVASLIDVASALAVFSAMSTWVEIRTLEMKVNYFRPVRSGEIQAYARLAHMGKRTAVTLCHVWGDGDTLCALGVATFLRLGDSAADEPTPA
ncbi:MAG: PaaI family thioesterase [Acidobacteria bacterium]|nr:PaaI family thioesterase [Acidobacteriota bacterium]MDW7984841.1 PaaI family thioesterase [Acidobacteriota bacterium]